MAIFIVDVGACHIFKAGLHNIGKRFVVRAVGDYISADLIVDFTNERSVYLDPTAVLGIQRFQSGSGQCAQQHVACGGCVAGGGILFCQGGAVCGIKCTDGAVDVCVCLRGTQADKHIIGKCGLQSCSAGYSFHPLVGGQRGIVAVAQVYKNSPAIHSTVFADRSSVSGFGQVHIYQNIANFQVALSQLYGTGGTIVHIRPYPNTAIEILYQHIVVNLIFCVGCGRGKFIHVPCNIAGIVE